MTIRSVVESLEDVPEALHELYEQDGEDGPYVLSKSVFEDHPAWKKLKGTANDLDRKKREAERKAKEYEARVSALPEDLDLEDVDEERREKAFQYLRGELDIEGDKKVDIDGLKASARKPLERELEKTRGEADQFRTLFTQTVRDQALSEALSAIRVADPLRPAVKAMFRDKAKVEIGDDGEVSVLIDGEYGPMDATSFFKEWAQSEQGAYFVQAPENRGGGAKGGGGNGKIPNPWSTEHWNMTEQARIFRQDPERAKKMAAEVGRRLG